MTKIIEIEKGDKMELELIKTNNDGFYSEIGLELFAQKQAKLTAKQIYEWGNEFCPHVIDNHVIVRRRCNKCWQELLEASK